MYAVPQGQQLSGHVTIMRQQFGVGSDDHKMQRI